MKKRMILLVEMVLENEFDDEWNVIFKKDENLIKSVMQDLIAERMRGEATVKIKKYRMEKMKNEK